MSSFWSIPANNKIWLIHADHDSLHFSMPVEYRRGGYAFCFLLLFGIFVFLYHFVANPQSAGVWLYGGVPLAIIDIGILLHLFSFSEIRINLKSRTYDTISRYPWRISIHQGHLDDFRGVYVSDRNSVSFALKKPGLSIRRVIPIGSAGLGKNGIYFAQEVSRLTGLEVMTKL
ncbi:MAG: hypothetical protein ACRYFS_11460 [Janthinobacterium lividum]